MFLDDVIILRDRFDPDFRAYDELVCQVHERGIVDAVHVTIRNWMFEEWVIVDWQLIYDHSTLCDILLTNVLTYLIINNGDITNIETSCKRKRRVSSNIFVEHDISDVRLLN